MTRVVSLAMYEPGGLATAVLWEGLRQHLESEGIDDLTESLSVPEDYEAAWLAANLGLSQTCGYPLRHALDGRVRYVGTPVYAVEGTEGPYYRSALVARADDPATDLAELRGRRAAYNSTTSQSGYNAFRDRVAPLARDGRFFSETLATGSHAASLRAVIADKADIAAIDPVSLALEGDEIRKGIKVIGWTDKAPGLPFITARTTSDEDVNRLSSGISNALQDPLLAAPLAYLKLTGFVILPPAAYDSIVRMERRAADLGYALLS